MAALQFVPQDVSSLEYHFFRGEARNLDRLTVISKTLVQLADGHTIRLAIIGESHFLVLFDASGRAIFSEVLACVSGFDFGRSPEVVLTGKKLCECQSFSHAITLGRYAYETKIRVRPYPHEPNFRGQEVVLREEFPWTEGRVRLVPKTVLALGSDARHLFRLTTVHEYPTSDGQGHVVVTKAKCRLFKLKR